MARPKKHHARKVHAKPPLRGKRHGKYRRFTVAGGDEGHAVEHAASGRHIPLGESREFAPFRPIAAARQRSALAQVQDELAAMSRTQRTALGVGAVLAGALVLVVAVEWLGRPAAPSMPAAPPVA